MSTSNDETSESSMCVARTILCPFCVTCHMLSSRIHPHEAKQNIHFRSTSISRTLFRFFSFSGTSVSLSKSRDTGAAQKKELVSPIQRATMLDITIGAAAPIGSVQYHHTYIGPFLVIPPRLFRGRDHLFTILPQHSLCHVPTAPTTPLLKTVFFTTSTIF